MRRRVFFVTNDARMMLVFRREMLQALSRIFEVTIVSPKDSESEKRFSEIGCRFIACEVDRRGMNLQRDVELIARYYRIFKKEKPDAIVSFTIKPNIYAGFVARALSIPFIATVEGLGSGWENAGILSKVVQRLYGFGLEGAKIVFVLNQHIFDELARVGVKKEKMKFLPGMGVNLEYFAAVPYPKDEDTLRLLTVGRVMREKGFPELIGAAHRLEVELPNLVWHVVGAPEEKEADLLEKLKTCKNVIYHGPQSDVRPYYAMCHATTTTTIYGEGISTVCLEAAASARPVLGTNEFGVRETFVEGITGFGIKKGDVADTVHVIKNFFAIPNSERAAMGEKARSYAEENFDRNKVTWSYFVALVSIFAEESSESVEKALSSIAQSSRLPSEVAPLKEGTVPETLERFIAKCNSVSQSRGSSASVRRARAKVGVSAGSNF